MTLEMIGNKIKSLREAKGWSQTKLGEQSKTSLRTVQTIEKGEKVRDSSIEKVANALGHKYVVEKNIIPIK